MHISIGEGERIELTEMISDANFYRDKNSCNCLVILCVLGLSGYFWHANRKADKGEKIIEGSKDFRYTL